MNLNLTPRKARIIAIVASLMAVMQIGFLVIDFMTKKTLQDTLIDTSVLLLDTGLAIFLFNYNPKPTSGA